MPLLKRFSSIVIALGLVAAVTLKAEVGPVPAASIAGITEYRLGNGLKVLLFPDNSQGAVTVNVTYLVGSRHENYGETGMAHLLEHMLFKGSKSHTNLVQEFAAHGAAINSASGTTTADRTNYSETIPASLVNLEWALHMEADRMVNSLIPKEALAGEMSIVRNEWERNESIPLVLVQKRAWRLAYDWHGYGRDPLGARSDVENVDLERLQAFYRTYYQPDNAVLLLAGKFDVDAALKAVINTLGRIPRPERKLSAPRTFEPPQDGERLITLHRSNGAPVLAAAYHIPAVAHPDSAAVEVLMQILAAPQGRLHRALVATQQASGVGAFFLPQPQPGLLTFFSSVSNVDSLPGVQNVMFKTIEASAEQPPSIDEVEHARTFLINSQESVLRSPEQIGVFLSDWIAAGDWKLFFLQQDLIKTVTTADVQRVAARYFRPVNRTVAVLLPDEKPTCVEIPASPDVAQLLKGYTGNAAARSTGDSFDATPGAIESHLRRFDLPVGLKLAVLPRKTPNNTVTIAMTLHLGNAAQMKDRSIAAVMVLRMLLSGTALHTRQQIQDEFTASKTAVIVTGDTMSTRIVMQTTSDQLSHVLSLMNENLRQPAFPAEQFEQIKQQTMAALQAQRSLPDSAAVTAFRHATTAYGADDPRYAASLEETAAQMKSVTLDDVRSFHSDFYGASNSAVAVVGPVDPDAIHHLMLELFGSWKSPNPYVKPQAPATAATPSRQQIDIADKPNAVVVAGLQVQVSERDQEYPALLLGNYLLGGNALNSRLASRLRQKDALSYSAGSVLSVDSIEPEGIFMISATLTAANATKVEAAIREEVDEFLKNGPGAEELQAAKSALLQARQLGRSRDPELAGLLVSQLLTGCTFTCEAELDNHLSGLTAAQVTAALRRYLDPKKLTWVKAGDFSKSGL